MRLAGRKAGIEKCEKNRDKQYDDEEKNEKTMMREKWEMEDQKREENS